MTAREASRYSRRLAEGVEEGYAAVGARRLQPSGVLDLHLDTRLGDCHRRQKHHFPARIPA